MGEAKRRRETDPFFGRRPKAGKGIVLSPPVTIDTGTNYVETRGGAIDRVELRRAVLFWDRLCKPQTKAISFGLSSDEEFLQKCGLLELREMNPKPADISQIMAQAYLTAFRELEEDEPGLWSISEGEKSFRNV